MLEAELVEHAVEQLPGLGPVEDAGARVEVELEGVVGHQGRPEGVVRADGDVGVGSQVLPDLGLEVGGRLIGEREPEHLVGPHLARLHQVQDAAGHDRGLAGSGPGHQQLSRPVGLDGLDLLGGQLHPAPTSRPAR